MTKKRKTKSQRSLEAWRVAFGRTLKELRESKQMTQLQLAQKMGVSQAQVCRLENGGQTFKLEVFYTLRNIFKISFSDFVRKAGF